MEELKNAWGRGTQTILNKNNNQQYTAQVDYKVRSTQFKMSHGRERDIACILYNVHLSIVHLSIIKGNSDQYAIALANKISTKDDIGKSYSSRVKSCISFDGWTGVRTIFTNLTNTLCMLLQAGISFIISLSI